MNFFKKTSEKNDPSSSHFQLIDKMDRQMHIVESFLLGAFKYRLTGSYAHILEEF